MDVKNRFHTRATYALERAEHIAIVGVCMVLSFVQRDAINWWHYLASFWIIDIVGYIPGAIAYRIGKGQAISPVFHVLYNLAHTYLVVGAGLGLWALVAGGFQWAMLGPIMHLSIDRGVFGNLFKPRTLSFEPVPAPLHLAARELGLVEGGS